MHLLSLDEDEHFSGAMLALSLRGVDPKHTGLSSELPGDPFICNHHTDSCTTCLRAHNGSGPSIRKQPVHTPPRSPPATPRVTWSVSLADGFDRLYRSWFENGTVSTAVDPVCPQAKANISHSLVPSSSGGLREVRLRCVQVAPAPSVGETPVEPRETERKFEYWCEGLAVDVARVLVRLEEQVGERREEAVVVLQWVRL